VIEPANEGLPNEPDAGTSPDNARAGYQATVTIYVNEANRLWARYQVILGVSTLLASGVVGLLLRTSPTDSVTESLSRGIPFLGVLVGLAWLAIHGRGDDYLEYYMRSARELEVNYLGPPVVTLDRGYRFSKGKKVSFDLPDPSGTHRLKWLWRGITMKFASNALVGLFILAFIWLGYLTWSVDESYVAPSGHTPTLTTTTPIPTETPMSTMVSTPTP
jgi:hypothetical protein